MAIKVEENKKSKPTTVKPYYPWIGILTDTGSVVLFTSANTGVVLVNNNDAYPAGYNSDHFLESYFVPYEGSITLSND